MNKTFTFGIITGITSLVVAVPLVAGIAGAQSTENDTAVPRPRFQRDLTQEDVQSMIDRDEAFLAHADASMDIRKNATRAHLDALQEALTLEDATARHDAVRAAHDALRQTMQDAMESNPDLAAAMHPGMGMGMGSGWKGGMFGAGFGQGNGPMHEEMLETLGMTQEEFDAAIASGKTPWEIAEEKGIEMPMHGGRGGKGGMRGGMFHKQ